MLGEVVAVPRRERPLEPSDDVVVRFARDLRLLREKAGSPTYRVLGARAHYSAASLADAAAGHKLPSLPVTLAYVEACGGDVIAWKARWHQTAAELAVGKEPKQVDEQAPYVGLTTFQQADADRFFGRENLVDDLLSRLRERRFLGVFGASGSGKSSLLRAGLAAHIAKKGGDAAAPVVIFTPGQHPIEECAVHLASFLGETPGTLLTEFSEQPRNLDLRIRQALAGDMTGADVVLVVDQFEEVFTLCEDEGERAAFIDALVFAATDSASRSRVVLGVRADFFGHCGRYSELVEVLRDAQVLVGAMTTDELRRAITGPAEQAGYRVETALVARLVADAARQPGMLPLVSHALLQTWMRRRGKVMTVAGYDTVGGIEHALARSAEAVFQTLDEDQRAIAKQIFLRLTVPGDGTEDTRRRIARTELDQDDSSTTLVLDTLTTARLITLERDSVELAHEALIRHWPRLREWLAEDREGHRLRRRLTDAAADWERNNRDEDLLYRGARLAAWRDRPLDRLNDGERAFLAASRRAQERRHRARRRRLRLTVGGLGAATIVVTVLAVVALMLAAQADDERTLAVGRQLVADARAQLQIDPELGLLLAREAYRTAPNEGSEAVLRQAVADSHVRATIKEDHQRLTGSVFSPDGKHVITSGFDGSLWIRSWHPDRGAGREATLLRSARSAWLWNPVFSPDGRQLAVMGDAGVEIWDWSQALAGNPSRIALQGISNLYWRVRLAFSPDGRYLASGSDDGAVRIWTVAGDGQPRLLHGHQGWTFGVSFSPDARWLASGGEDGTIRLWTIANDSNPVVLRRHIGTVEAVAFSPDSRHLASASTDGSIRVWDPTGATPSTVLGRHDGEAFGVSFSPDGHAVVSTGSDGTVRVWNADQAAAPVVLRGHRGDVWSAVFSADGAYVASVADDGTVKIWAVEETAQNTTLRGIRGAATSVAVGPDGRLAIGGDDGVVRVIDVSGDDPPITLTGNTSPVASLTIVHDGRQVVAVTEDDTVSVWQVHNPGQPMRFHTENNALLNFAGFSRDGSRFAAVDMAGNLSVWQIPHSPTTAALRADILPNGPTPATLPHVVWSADGHHVAAAVNDTVQLWDLRTDARPTQLPGDSSPIKSLAFSADGHHLAAGDDDGTTHLWRDVVTASTEPVALPGHRGAVTGIAFSAHDRQLITIGIDTAIHIWTTSDAREPLVLDDFRASTNALATFPDGRIATAHSDGTIRLWRCPACGPITAVLSRATKTTTRELTPHERRTYLDIDS